MKNPTYDKSSESHTIKIMVLCIICLMSIQLITAMDWDNIQDVKETKGLAGYNNIKIYNSWIIPNLIKGDLLWNGTLNYNSNNCSINCQARQTITLHEKGVLIEEVIFKTLQLDGGWVKQDIRSYQIYANNNPYELGTELEVGTYEVLLKGSKKSTRTVDWIYITQGETLESWAQWGSATPVEPIIYWNADSNAGDQLIDNATGRANLTKTGATVPPLIGGIINDGTTGNESGWNASVLSNIPDDWDLRDTNWTISFWFNMTDVAQVQDIFTSTLAGNNIFFQNLANGKMNVNLQGDSDPIEFIPNLNQWYMYTIVANSTNASAKDIYIDGVFNVTLTNAGALNLTAILESEEGFVISANGIAQYDGVLDEIGIYNESLGQEFITALHNNGNAIPHPFIFNSVALNFPIDNFVTALTEVQFNSSAITTAGSTIINMSLYHNATGVWHRNLTIDITPGGQTTNTSTINQTFTNGQTVLWNMEWCDNEGDCGQSGTNRTFSIDQNNPGITLRLPRGVIDIVPSGNNEVLNWTVVDDNIDTIWWDYNGTNTTLVGADSQTTFTLDINVLNGTLYANDTAGNINSTFTNWSYGFIEDSITFTSNVFETSNQEFELNLTTSLDVLTIDAFLLYNGTSDRSEASCDAGECTLMNVIDIPLVQDVGQESQNKTFFWNITIFNGTDSINVQTSENEQNVSRIHLEACDDAFFNTTTLNFTAFDEQNLTAVSPYDFNGDFATWLGSGNIKRQNNVSNLSAVSVGLCLTPNQTHFIDGQIAYDESGSSSYTERNYFFQNDTISNDSQDIGLGLLIASDSTSFILKVQDTNILPVGDVLIFTERFYPGLGEFRVVQVARTDDNGGSVGFFKTETIDYRFRLKQNNTEVLLTDQQKIVGESAPFTLTFTIGEDRGAAWEDFEDTDNLDADLSYNKTSQIATFAYTDTSGIFFSGNLTILRIMSNGTPNIVVCSKISFQSSATLACNLTGNETGSYSGQGIITRDDETIIGQVLFQIVFGIETFSDIAGDLGLFLGWFVILISCFAFKFNEIAGIFMVNVAVIGVNLIGLIAFGPVFITAMIALSIFIAVVLER